METQLNRIPAFGRAIWDEVEDILGDDVESFRDWLSDKSIVFRDSRCFDFHILAGRGYTVLDLADLQSWIDKWNAGNSLSVYTNSLISFAPVDEDEDVEFWPEDEPDNDTKSLDWSTLKERWAEQKIDA